MKMYIAVLDKVPSHMVPVLVAHAVLGAHLECYSPQNVGNDYQEFYRSWLKTSFRKVVLKVNQKEFDKIVLMEAVYLAHENSTIEGIKSCAVICPRIDYPNVIKFAKMWAPD